MESVGDAFAEDVAAEEILGDAPGKWECSCDSEGGADGEHASAEEFDDGLEDDAEEGVEEGPAKLLGE